MEEEQKGLLHILWGSSKTAGAVGAVRAGVATPLVEVPATNIELIRQQMMASQNRFPLTGRAIIREYYQSGQLARLFTGLSTNVTKNFTREFAKAFAFCIVPFVAGKALGCHRDSRASKIVTTISLIKVNGLMNQFYDSIRNHQINQRNAYNTGKRSLSGLAAMNAIFNAHGIRGFASGLGVTMLYSWVFWGSYSISREAGLEVAKALGGDEKFSTHIAVNTVAGFSAAVVTMPIEHVRYRMIGGGDYAGKTILDAFKAFHESHVSKLGLRAYYVGFAQSLPIQLSAAWLAGYVLFQGQRSKASKAR